MSILLDLNANVNVDQLAFWINYGSLLHIKGHTQYIIPLS